MVGFYSETKSDIFEKKQKPIKEKLFCPPHILENNVECTEMTNEKKNH